jgi:stalled ribosome rescue protein Dom34
MNKKVGLWIDHRTAIVVSIVDGAANTEHIASGVDKHGRFSGHAASTDGVADDQRDRKFAAHLGKYYDDVITHLRDAESIFVFGPGEAKGEFEKHLIAKGLGKHIVGVETVDKMTDHQIAAKVRLHFQQQARGLV